MALPFLGNKSQPREKAIDERFESYLAAELMVSEQLRSMILIVAFSLITVGFLVLTHINAEHLEIYSQLEKYRLWFIAFFGGIVVYELWIWFLIKKTLEKGKLVSGLIRWGSACEEASIPTIGIFLFAHAWNPMEALLGPGSFLYFIFILLGALRLDFILSVVTGLVSAIEYYLLTFYYLHQPDLSLDLSIYMSGSVLPKAGMLLLAGIITGVVCLEIKRRIGHSFHSIEEQNRILEQKVKVRTKELETLNQSLAKKVEEEVLKRREQEQLLIQQSKMSAMGEMISMIAHQWRQPLSSIGTMIGTLKVLFDLDQLEKDNFNQFVDDINEQTQYLSTTITDFRKFLSTTKVLEISNLNDIVENALKIIGKSLENKNIRIEKEYEFSKPIKTYPNELMQVVINILKNAQDACVDKTVETPRITIRGSETSDRQSLSIMDNAGGIPDTVIGRIFDPYFTTKGEEKGTGLGLYMSKTIIETHCHGELNVSNLNGGACFNIVLPSV